VKATSSLLPPSARGRRWKLFPDGDVFIYRKRADDGSLEPLSRTDEDGDSVPLQFHNVEDAHNFLKSYPKKDIAGQTIIIAQLRKLFEVEVQEDVKIRFKEKKRSLAEPKTTRNIPTEVHVERDEESA